MLPEIPEPFLYLAPAHTERLLIRPLNENDISVWLAFFKDKEGLQFLNFNPEIPDDEKSRVWVERQLERYRNIQFGLKAIISKDSKKLIGQCGLLVQEVNGKREIEIGYHILPEYRGNGFATEAARYFKQLAFLNNLSESLISIIHIENIRSQKVAEKNGMQPSAQTEFNGRPVYIYRISQESV